jgi:hypothetical protein
MSADRARLLAELDDLDAARDRAVSVFDLASARRDLAAMDATLVLLRGYSARVVEVLRELGCFEKPAP